MPAISFQRQFLDALLRGDKQQTTRKQAARIKVGDIAQIYIDQRAQLTGKPIRVMTGAGTTAITNRVNDAQYNYPTECPPSPFREADGKYKPAYYAHSIGEVTISDVFDVDPGDIYGRSEWARKDGFPHFYDADKWFTAKYGDDWMQRTWTVIRWNGWAERYFEPKP